MNHQQIGSGGEHLTRRRVIEVIIRSDGPVKRKLMMLLECIKQFQ